MPTPRILAVLAAAPLVLAACSAPPTGQDTGAPTELHAPHTPPGLATWKAADGPAEWVCHDPATGVAYTIPVPLNKADERIAKTEQVRTQGGGKPVEYVIVEIDATAATATGPHSVWGASWATADQRNAGAHRVIQEGWDINWTPSQWDPEEPAQTGARGSQVLVLDQPPLDSMVAPTVLPSATPVPCELYPPA